MSGAERSVRIPMADGVELAATLYLPDTPDPQPCLLEALPYRKDDLTSSYAEGYRSLRDEHSYAVCRLDLRGTGSSAGDATDEYPLVERTDLCTVIAWLAEQEWCDGNVGMFGTSYSGFNSLQIAAERPPALKAIVAIYSSDDRWTDDVHWRGHALRLVDLVDYCHYMTPMCVLPPVPAEWPADDGQSWRQEWKRRWETNEPWLLTWLRENRDGPYWQAGSLRHLGYDRIQAATMIVAGWADGYRNNSFRTVEALGAAGTPWRLLAGPWAHADPASAIPGPRIDLDREMVAWWDRWLRGTAADEWTDRADVFVRTSTVPEPDLELHEGHWVSGPWPPPDAGVATLRARRSALARGRAGHRRLGVDRLRRPPAVGALRRPARGRRALPDVGLGRAAHRGRAARGPAPTQRVRPRSLAVGQALRRLPRRHVGAHLPWLPGPGVPRLVIAGAAGARRGVRRHADARRMCLPTG